MKRGHMKLRILMSVFLLLLAGIGHAGAATSKAPTCAPSGELRGDAKRGAPLHLQHCAGCHGVDGKGVPDSAAIGGLALDNPWEVMHKISFGQPDEAMPAMLEEIQRDYRCCRKQRK